MVGNKGAPKGAPVQQTGNPYTSVANNTDQVTLAAFSNGDVELPANWPTTKKALVLIIGIALVLNSTLGSSLPSGASDFLSAYFGVTSPQQLTLPNATYLIGYIFGPPLFSPLSEMYGRRIVILTTFFGFTIFTMACALASSWPALLTFRFITGSFASAPISVVGGIYADIYDDPVQRGRAVAALLGSTTLGPVIGPVISGFASPVSWRWTFWIALIIAGATWPLLVFLPESYPPVILYRRVKKMREFSGVSNVYAPMELEKKGWKHTITVKLARPIIMFKEPIVLCSCLYLALEYAIFYLFFQAYPIVFQGTYHFSNGISGLAMLPIAIGATIACFISLWYDRTLRQAKERNAPWSNSEEYRRLPLACIGGPLHVISLFWLGWTARVDIHWIVPVLAGLPFGIGIELTFISLLNYLTDAYDIFAASAQASSAFSRSIFAVLLPLAAVPMYARLGIAWSSSLLGFLSLVMAVIPFFFLKYGDWLRRRSPFCQELSKRREHSLPRTSGKATKIPSKS